MLEVGLGGRLDSTNVVRPVLSIITSISFDHMRQLGNHLASIATEKAGILKRGRPGISGACDAEARIAIRRVARQRRCMLREIHSDFWYEDIPPVPPLERPTAGHVAVQTWRRDWGELTLPLLGSHQAHNVAVVLAGLDLLAEVEPALAVTRDDVVRGFAALRVAGACRGGRRETLAGDRRCAQRRLGDALWPIRCARAFRRRAGTLVFGTTRDKDLPGQLKALLPCFDTFIATRYVENPRSVPPEAIAEQMLALSGRRAHIAAEPAGALAVARELTDADGLICVTGSLFLAAEARAIVLDLARPPSFTRVVT